VTIRLADVFTSFLMKYRYDGASGFALRFLAVKHRLLLLLRSDFVQRCQTALTAPVMVCVST